MIQKLVNYLRNSAKDELTPLNGYLTQDIGEETSIIQKLINVVRRTFLVDSESSPLLPIRDSDDNKKSLLTCKCSYVLILLFSCLIVVIATLVLGTDVVINGVSYIGTTTVAAVGLISDSFSLSGGVGEISGNNDSNESHPRAIDLKATAQSLNLKSDTVDDREGVNEISGNNDSNDSESSKAAIQSPNKSFTVDDREGVNEISGNNGSNDSQSSKVAIQSLNLKSDTIDDREGVSEISGNNDSNDSQSSKAAIQSLNLKSDTVDDREGVNEISGNNDSNDSQSSKAAIQSLNLKSDTVDETTLERTATPSGGEEANPIDTANEIPNLDTEKSSFLSMFTRKIGLDAHAYEVGPSDMINIKSRTCFKKLVNLGICSDYHFRVTKPL